MKRILFIGNSHTYFNDMPATFADMWELGMGERPEITMLAYSGRTLEWHNTEYFSVRFNLLYGNYDICVIQQLAHPFPGKDATKEGLTPILNLCSTVGVIPYIIQTWTEKKNRAGQAVMTQAYRELSKELNIRLIPVGEAWDSILNSCKDIQLYWKDGAHASPEGDYLIACCIFAALTEGKKKIPDTCRCRNFLEIPEIDFAKPRAIEMAGRTEIVLESDKAEKIRIAVQNLYR